MHREFPVGSRIYSARYGRGEVVAIDGYGDKEKLTIRFEEAGTKEVLSRYFRLEPYDNQIHEQGSPVSDPEPEREPTPEPTAVQDVTEGGGAMPDRDEIREVLREALREVLMEERGEPAAGMLERWKGGTLILQPGRDGQKPKEIPIDDFFHKIVMLRDRLRTLEQKINGHQVLGDAEKVELQQYITRIYGSLTTFNVLFADREGWFVGQKGG